MSVSRLFQILAPFALFCVFAAPPIAAHPDHHSEDLEEEPSAFDPPVISSQADVARLETLQGISLQWISWDERGEISITRDEGVWYLSGALYDDSGAGI